MKYETINDAAFNSDLPQDIRTSLFEVEEGTGSKIWYSVPPGKLKEHREAYVDLIAFGTGFDPETVETTHTLLGEIQELDPDVVFKTMQAEIWSPCGEARELIRRSGSGHTTMMVGDVIEQSNAWLVCLPAGWLTVPKNPKKGREAKLLSGGLTIKEVTDLDFAKAGVAMPGQEPPHPAQRALAELVELYDRTDQDRPNPGWTLSAADLVEKIGERIEEWREIGMGYRSRKLAGVPFSDEPPNPDPWKREKENLPDVTDENPVSFLAEQLLRYEVDVRPLMGDTVEAEEAFDRAYDEWLDGVILHLRAFRGR